MIQRRSGKPSKQVKYAVMTHLNWNEVKSVQVDSHVTRQAIHTGNMTVARLEIRQGGVVPEHHHHNEQITMVSSGALQFAIDGGERVVRGGETLVIPPHMPHGVVALEDTVVFDVFAPGRDDWPR
jgi:quercetin dioxygenase-like cupin family protein